MKQHTFRSRRTVSYTLTYMLLLSACRSAGIELEPARDAAHKDIAGVAHDVDGLKTRSESIRERPEGGSPTPNERSGDEIVAEHTDDSSSVPGINAARSPASSAPEKEYARAIAPTRKSKHADARVSIGAAKPSSTGQAVSAAYGPKSGAGMGAGIAMQAPAEARSFNTEAYAYVQEHGFTSVVDQPLSTLSADVDTASYANVRRFLREGSLPPPDAVRLEEMVNYFRYADARPSGNEPFAVTTELTACPWNLDHQLLRVGLTTRPIPTSDLPARNLVLLADVSGSMQSPDKLPLLKHGLSILVHDLRPHDRLSLVVYAGASGLVLPPTSGTNKQTILDALASLESGGSTNGAEGIQLAYRTARQAFIRGGINRVILATDGDFNVGLTSEGELTRLIEHERRSGVFLTVLGFGRGNLKDSTMEMLADKGNGNYGYVDSEAEARKLLVREAGATLVTIAKDVKLQIEMNPARVASYRLLGYENRRLSARDFKDDGKDAGEIGAGHAVTVLYEIVPTTTTTPRTEVDALRYQTARAALTNASSHELATVKVRYKHPAGATSTETVRYVTHESKSIAQASDDMRFSAAVASFGMVLRASSHRGRATTDSVLALARSAFGHDQGGLRHEFVSLVETAKHLGADARAGSDGGQTLAK